MTTFLSSSNLSCRLRELAYTSRAHGERLRDYADDLDRAAEKHTLSGSPQHLADMMLELAHARTIYAEVAGKPLTAD